MLDFLSSHFRWALASLLLLALGCAGAKEEPQTADPDMSPGKRCLAEASAPRAPSPGAPQAIVASHILIRHKDLKRPEGATLTREQACLKALQALTELTASGEWDHVVESFSDSGKSTHGELGKISQDDVTPAFRDAAFALDVNELSYVVETDRGFHIILRTE